MSHLFKIFAFLSLLAPAVAQDKNVVELFTSQGCSSCPPADRYFGELNTRPNLILISWNVDYWDYLGWKDTLGDPSYSKRQRAYSLDNKVYTPQMIVNGKHYHVGSEKREVEGSLNKAESPNLKVVVSQEGDKISVSLPDSAHKNLTILAVPVALQKQVKILRGENKGETMNYYRIARGLLPLGVYDGKAKELTFSRAEKLALDADRLVVLIQRQDDRQAPRAIVGAAEITLK